MKLIAPFLEEDEDATMEKDGCHTERQRGGGSNEKERREESRGRLSGHLFPGPWRTGGEYIIVVA